MSQRRAGPQPHPFSFESDQAYPSSHSVPGNATAGISNNDGIGSTSTGWTADDTIIRTTNFDDILPPFFGWNSDAEVTQTTDFSFLTSDPSQQMPPYMPQAPPLDQWPMPAAQQHLQPSAPEINIESSDVQSPPNPARSPPTPPSSSSRSQPSKPTDKQRAHDPQPSPQYALDEVPRIALDYLRPILPRMDAASLLCQPVRARADLFKWLRDAAADDGDSEAINPKKRPRYLSDPEFSRQDRPEPGSRKLDPIAKNILDDVLKKIRAIAVLHDSTSPLEVIRWLEILSTQSADALPSNPVTVADSSLGAVNESHPHDMQDSDVQLFQRYASGLRRGHCDARGQPTDPASNPLQCLRKSCKASFAEKKRHSWLRHIEQVIPEKLHMCPFCEKICIRIEWVANHIRKKHSQLFEAELTKTPRQMCEKAERKRPKSVSTELANQGKCFEVPFSMVCGWCDHKSDDWKEFYEVHVHHHFVAEGRDKEDWRGEYPPNDGPRRSSPRAGCFDLGPSSSKRDDDSDDDDDDANDDLHPPGPAPRERQSLANSSVRSKHARSGGNDRRPRTNSQNQRTAAQSFNTESENVMDVDLLASITDSFRYLQVRDASDFNSRPGIPPAASLSTLPYGKSTPLSMPFHHLKSIFRGTSTIVDAVVYPASGQILARKRVRSPINDTHVQALYRREVEVMRSIHHVHIIELVDHFMSEGSYSLILQPVADGSLKQYLERRPEGCEQNLLTWRGCLASCVEYLHSEEVNICHQDIKPANILIQHRSAMIHLADFGSSRFAQADPQSQSAPMTPMYSAPEVIQRRGRDKAADIWALGLVFLEMLTALCHIRVQDFHSWMRQVFQNGLQYTVPLERHSALLRWIGRLRATGNSASKSNCVGKLRALDHVEAMISFLPEQRPGAQTVAQWEPHSCPSAQRAINNPQTLPADLRLSRTMHPCNTSLASERNGGSASAPARPSFGSLLSDFHDTPPVLRVGSWCDADLGPLQNEHSRAQIHRATGSAQDSSGFSISFSRIHSTPNLNFENWERDRPSLPKKGERNLSTLELLDQSEVSDGNLEKIKNSHHAFQGLAEALNPAIACVARLTSQIRRIISVAKSDHFKDYCEGLVLELDALLPVLERCKDLDPVKLPSQSSVNDLALQSAFQHPEQELVSLLWQALRAMMRCEHLLDKDESAARRLRACMVDLSRLTNCSLFTDHKDMAPDPNQYSGKTLAHSSDLRFADRNPGARWSSKLVDFGNRYLKSSGALSTAAASNHQHLSEELVIRGDPDKTEMVISYVRSFPDRYSAAERSPIGSGAVIHLMSSFEMTPDHVDELYESLFGMLQGLCDCFRSRDQSGQDSVSHSHLWQLGAVMAENIAWISSCETRDLGKRLQRRSLTWNTNFRGSSNRSLRKSATWPIVRRDLQSASRVRGCFVVFAGELHLQHQSDDLQAHETKWQAWSSLCHNVPWRMGDDDLAYLDWLAKRYFAKHLAMNAKT